MESLSLEGIREESPEILNTLLKVYLLDNRDEYRKSKQGETAAKEVVKEDGLLAMGGTGASISTEEPEKVFPVIREQNVIFAVDDYADDSDSPTSALNEITADFDFTKIIPRSQKAKEIQKRRVKEKAEVFTPTWVCNVQNNLVDDEAVGVGAFNTVSTDDGGKTWEPSSSPVFSDSIEAIDYIHSNRMEITCGEGPYLVSRYDTVTGDGIPVRDDENRFQRIGLLDRKLRVVTEFAGPEGDREGDIGIWKSLAFGAFCSTYGYEWQGDNLLLARLNLLNTYIDYYKDAWGALPSEEDVHQIAVVISMNLWQMDGLRAVLPLSAGEDRGMSTKEIKPERATGLYDGKIPVIAFNQGNYPYWEAFGDGTESHQITYPEWFPFEDMLSDWLKKRVK